MTDRLRFTLLGCGSSPGTPRINGDWGACDPVDPRNRRSRASLLVERLAEGGGATRVVIDTGPDFRRQMIDAGPGSLDAVLYTHPHADHIHGIDDLRTYVLDRGRMLDVHANRHTLDRLVEAFGYCFQRPAGSSYPPILRAHEIATGEMVNVAGEGGDIRFEALEQIHGGIASLAFRVGPVAYCCDVSAFPDRTAERLHDLDVLIIDALQYRRHPSHFSLGEALEWIEMLAPRRAILTHMHIPLDYRTVLRETPDHVEPGYDGLVFEVPASEKMTQEGGQEGGREGGMR